MMCYVFNTEPVIIYNTDSCRGFPCSHVNINNECCLGLNTRVMLFTILTVHECYMKHYYCTALLSAQDAALKTNEHTTAPPSSAMFKTSYFSLRFIYQKTLIN